MADAIKQGLQELLDNTEDIGLGDIEDILREYEIGSSDLDEVVHALHGSRAAEINNQGVRAQLQFVEQASGFTRQQLMQYVVDMFPECRKAPKQKPNPYRCKGIEHGMAMADGGPAHPSDWPSYLSDMLVSLRHLAASLEDRIEEDLPGGLFAYAVSSSEGHFEQEDRATYLENEAVWETPDGISRITPDGELL